MCKLASVAAFAVFSVRLTSFVVKSYCKAKTTKLISVDEDQICESVEWIVKQQDKSGQFTDDGCLHNKAMMVRFM